MKENVYGGFILFTSFTFWKTKSFGILTNPPKSSNPQIMGFRWDLNIIYYYIPIEILRYHFYQFILILFQFFIKIIFSS